MVKQGRCSGISSPEPTEVETYIREIVEKGEEAQNAVTREEKIVVKKERETAELVRR